MPLSEVLGGQAGNQVWLSLRRGWYACLRGALILAGKPIAEDLVGGGYCGVLALRWRGRF